MTRLDSWLKRATRRLSSNSVVQVRTQIQEHYESAREAAISGGATPDEADQLAVAALGDPRTANCQYRNVLLTSEEAFLPIYNPSRARVFRRVKWVALIGALVVVDRIDPRFDAPKAARSRIR